MEFVRHFPMATSLTDIYKLWTESITALYSSVTSFQNHSNALATALSGAHVANKGNIEESLVRDPVFHILCHHASRVSSLDMEAQRLEDVEKVIGVLGNVGSGTHLDTLSLSSKRMRGHVINTNVPQDLCQRVQNLTLIGIHFPWDSAVYAGLTRLKLSGINEALNADQMVAIVHASPRLKGFVIEYIDIHIPSNKTYMPISLQNLKTLSITQPPIESEEFGTEERWSQTNSFLFSILKTPNLVSLSISGLYTIPPQIFEFVERLKLHEESTGAFQAPKLAFLRIADCGFSMPQVRSLLTSLSNIVHMIVFEVDGFNDSVLESLVVKQPGSSILPKLKVLQVTRCIIMESSLLQDIVQSRLKAKDVADIEKLVVTRCRFINPQLILRWMKQHVREVRFAYCGISSHDSDLSDDE
ncbi:hypothetical protein FRC03_004342 [Tulasnella sp. 419]|nr:hypothetical protein FRC03_004342 [Tulasnella sp. 419]